MLLVGPAVEGQRIQDMIERLNDVTTYMSGLSEEDRAVAGFGDESAKLLLDELNHRLLAVSMASKNEVAMFFESQLSRIIRNSIKFRGNQARFGISGAGSGYSAMSNADLAACSDLSDVLQSQILELRLVAPGECCVQLLNEVPFGFSLERMDVSC